MSSPKLDITIKLLTQGLEDVKALSTAILGLGTSAQKIEEGAKGAADAMGEMAGASSDTATSLSGIATSAKAAGVGMAAAATSGDDAAEALATARSEALRLAGGLQQVADVSSRAAAELQDSAKAAQDKAQADQDAADKSQGVATALEDQAKAAQDAANQLNDAAKAAQDAATASGDLAATDAATALQGMATAAQDVATALQDDATAAKDTALALQSTASASQDVAKELQAVAISSQTSATGLQDVAWGANEAALGAQSLGTKLSIAGTTLANYGTAIRGLINGNADAAGAMVGAGNASDTLMGKVKALALEHSGAVKATTEFGLGMRALGPQAALAEGAADKLTSGIKFLAGGLLAVAGIKISFDYLKEAVSYAARVDTLGLTLGVVGQNAGYSTAETAKFESGLKKLGISTEAARDSMIQMIQAGIPLGTQSGQSASNVERLARAAQDLAVVTGENSSDTLKRMITNVQQMDTMGLRFMGISVDMTAANQKFAVQLGTTAGALTDTQKKQAVMNEVLEQSTKLQGAYEISLESVGKQVSSMKRYTEELNLALGNKLLPVYGAVVAASTELLKGLQETTAAFDKNGQAAGHYGDATKAVMAPLVGITQDLWKWVLQLGASFGSTFESIGSIIGGTGDVLRSFLRAVMDGGGMAVLQAAVEVVNLAFAALADGIKIVKLVFTGFIGAFAIGAKGIVDAALLIAEALPDGPWKEKLKAMSADMGKLADDSTNTIRSIESDFFDGKTALGEWGRELKGSSEELKKMDASPARIMKEQIRELVKAQNESTISSIGAIAKYEEMSKSLLAAKESGAITGKEFNKLNLQLQAIKKVISEELDGALKLLKTTSKELSTGISEDSGVIIGALRKVAENGVATAEQFALAFSKNVSMAKNVEELNGFTGALVKAKDRWKETPELFSQAMGQVAKQFDVVYEKQLEAVTTGAQWDTLKASIKAMGEQGVLSAGEVASAIGKGEEAVRRLNPAYISAAAASEKIGAAVKGVDVQMKLLDSTIKQVAEEAVAHYGAMAKGYSDLGKDIDKSTGEQISAIEKRFAKESSLIENSGTNTVRIEREKSQLIIEGENAKIAAYQQGYDEAEKMREKEATALRQQTEAKNTAIDKEVIKVQEALGKQGDKNGEYAQKLKGLEEQRAQNNRDTEAKILEANETHLTKLKEKYQAHVDKLSAEEDRLLGKIKSNQAEIEGLKQSGEEKIRSMLQSTMSDAQKFDDNRKNSAELTSKAITAAQNGETETAKNLFSQAKAAATALNTEIKDGEKVIRSKAEAQAIALEAFKTASAAELAAVRGVGDGYKAQKVVVSDALNTAQTQLSGVNTTLESVRVKAEKGIAVNIKVNQAEAENNISTLDKLIKEKSWIAPIRVQLDAGKDALDRMLRQVEQGGEYKLDAKVDVAEAALKKVRDDAEKDGNFKLVAEAQDAIDKIEKTKQNIKELAESPNNKVKVDVDSEKAQTEVTKVKTKVEEISPAVAKVNATPLKVQGETTWLDALLGKLSAAWDWAKKLLGIKDDAPKPPESKKPTESPKPVDPTKSADPTKTPDPAATTAPPPKPKEPGPYTTPPPTTPPVNPKDSEEYNKANSKNNQPKKQDGTQTTTTTKPNAPQPTRDDDYKEVPDYKLNTNNLGNKQGTTKEKVYTDGKGNYGDNAGRDQQQKGNDRTEDPQDVQDALQGLSDRSKAEAAAALRLKAKSELEKLNASKKTTDAKEAKAQAARRDDLEQKAVGSTSATKEIELKIKPNSDKDLLDKATNETTSEKPVEPKVPEAAKQEIKDITDTTPVTKPYGLKTSGVDENKEAMQDINDPAPINKEFKVETDGVEENKEAMGNLNSDPVSKEFKLNTEGVEENSTAMENLNSETVDKEFKLDTTGVEENVTAMENLNDEPVTKYFSLETDGVEENATAMENLNDDPVTKQFTLETSGVEENATAMENLNDEAVTKGFTLETSGVEENATAMENLNDDPVTKSFTLETNGIEENATAMENLNDEPVTKSFTLETSGVEENATAMENLNDEPVSKNFDLVTSGVKENAEAMQSLNEDPVTKEFSVETTGVEEAAGAIQSVAEGEYQAFIGATADASEAQIAIEEVVYGDYTAELGVESDIEDAQARLIDLTEPLETDLTVTSDAAEEVPLLDKLEEKLVTPLEIDANMDQLDEAKAIAEEGTESTTEMSADETEVLAAKKRARKSTFSTHYILGGFMDGGAVGGFAGAVRGKSEGGDASAPSAMVAVPAGADFTHQAHGVIPGAGNTDSVPRTLDTGSFVIRKSVVEGHGQSRLMSLIDKAMSLPRLDSGTPSGKIRAMTMPGEIVVGKEAASRIGFDRLSALNDPRSVRSRPELFFAEGGLVSRGVPAFALGGLVASSVGHAFEAGGEVPDSAPSSVTQIDLRGNNAKATVTAADKGQSANLIQILSELKSRS